MRNLVSIQFNQIAKIILSPTTIKYKSQVANCKDLVKDNRAECVEVIEK